MKQKLKTNKPICSRNDNERVGAERINTRPIRTMPAHNKGITLIALILTIIILLILAVVAISAVRGDGIISHAKNAKTDYTNAQEEEQIQIALNEWKIKDIQNNKKFTEFMQEKFGKDNVEKVTENEVIVTMESGNKYKVTAEGTIISTKGVNLNKSSLVLELKEGTIATETLTASLSEITGEITWSNSDNTKATISSTKGESIIVTAVAKGETTITATCGDYTATCKVIVENAMEIGNCVKYDVPYTDMYSGIEYTADNGWRYIGKDDNGNKLIVSTGIPAILNYSYRSNIGNEKDEGANTWWATKAEISLTTDTLYRTDKGYDYNNDSGEPGKYASYGLRYKFESILFNYQESKTSVSTANTGIYRKIGTQESGELSKTAFRANGVNVVDVHNLTLTEFERAITSASGSLYNGLNDLTGVAQGLINLRQLENYGETTEYGYYLSAPGTLGNERVAKMTTICSSINHVRSGGFNSDGVRPVVTLSSEVQLVDANGDGVLEIQ